jgi:hypothetical protein
VINLLKQQPKIWDSLWVEGLNREDIAKRREEDLEEIEKLEQDRYKEQQIARQRKLG